MTATISAAIASATCAGDAAAEVEAGGAVDPVEVGLGEALLERARRGGAPGCASRRSRRRSGRCGASASAIAGNVEPLLVGERDDDRALVDPVGDLVGPGLDDLVGARDALRGRERGARVDDGRAPAELLAVGAEMLGGLGGAEDHDAERALDHLGEDAVVAQAGALEHAALEPLLAGARCSV